MTSQVLLNNAMAAQFGSPRPGSGSEALPAGLPTITRTGPSSASLSSMFRTQSPVLGALPPAVFEPYGVAIPEDAVAHGAPAWPGLGVLANGGMPSPALTERSSHHAPEGLLDPTLGTQLGSQGMGSSAAISLRDDIDYSRPIGGLVNNRMYSTSSIPTVTTTPEATRRNSFDSERSQYSASPGLSPHLS